MTRWQALCPPAPGDGDTVVYMKWAHPIRSKAVEQVGKRHLQLQLKLAGLKLRRQPADDAQRGQQCDNAIPKSLTKEQRSRSEATRILQAKNHYEVFGLGDVLWGASESKIKKAYQRLLLRLHPDKRRNGATVDPDAHQLFLRVQQAWEVLSDPFEKRIYDSQLEFNEDIPDADMQLSDEEFFDVYEPVFARNARFSNRKPVPTLGSICDPWEQVEAFYHFWFTFDSWREMPASDDYDLKNAGSREERRWMERQMKKEREAAKKQDTKRLMTLVKQAYAIDPRVRAYNDKKIAQQAELQRNAEFEERRRVEAERQELQLAEEKQRIDRERAKTEKKYLRLLRSTLRKVAQHLVQQKKLDESVNQTVQHESTVCDRDTLLQLFQQLSLSTDATQLRSMADDADYSSIAEDATLILQNFLDSRSLKQAKGLPLKREGPVNTQTTASVTHPWGADELSYLAKGVAKFPGGTRTRWQQIADYIVTASQGRYHRSKAECVAKAQELQGKSSPARQSQPNTTIEESPLKAANNAAHQAGVWSEDQQEALEAALKSYPAKLKMEKAERWKAIAALVPGKTRKECLQRFKEIREKLKTTNLS